MCRCAAETEIETLQDGRYTPNGIVACADDGHLIHEGEDNIDINAETIDGKTTFHSKARVVFSRAFCFVLFCCTWMLIIYHNTVCLSRYNQQSAHFK